MKLCLRVPMLGSEENFTMVQVRDDGEFTVSLGYQRVAARGRERATATIAVASRLTDDRRGYDGSAANTGISAGPDCAGSAQPSAA